MKIREMPNFTICKSLENDFLQSYAQIKYFKRLQVYLVISDRHGILIIFFILNLSIRMVKVFLHCQCFAVQLFYNLINVDKLSLKSQYTFIAIVTKVFVLSQIVRRILRVWDKDIIVYCKRRHYLKPQHAGCHNTWLVSQENEMYGLPVR